MTTLPRVQQLVGFVRMPSCLISFACVYSVLTFSVYLFVVCRPVISVYARERIRDISAITKLWSLVIWRTGIQITI